MSDDKPSNNMIAIASGKGGVGKTWFSITLATALAFAGRRVLLFDGDLGLANIDIQLGLMPEFDVGQAIAGKTRLTRCVTKFPDGKFDVLAGRSGSGSLATLPAPRVERLLRELTALAGQYDHVLIDLGAGVDRTVQTLAARSGRTLLVVNDEPTSLTDAYAFVKLGWSMSPDMRVGVIVNAVESPAAGRKTYETLSKACQNFLNKAPDLAGLVRRDARVPDAIRAQQPLLLRSPTSEAGSDVEAVARTLF